MDSGNGEISVNPNDQCRLCIIAASKLNLSFNLSKRKDCKGEVLKFYQLKTSRKLDLRW